MWYGGALENWGNLEAKTVVELMTVYFPGSKKYENLQIFPHKLSDPYFRNDIFGVFSNIILVEIYK